MKEIENDKQLKSLMKETRFEKPGNKFTLNVMNEIFALEAAKALKKGVKVLGKNFWIIVSLFIILGTTIIILSVTGILGESSVSLLPEAPSSVTDGYQSIYEKIGRVPLSIAAILTASSILLLVERILSKKNLLT
ncbi:MAG: hypothetical protein HQ541_01465 [Mariniphaga sp.]|nr:hypothetical protein [Mariniphaga sp.]